MTHNSRGSRGAISQGFGLIIFLTSLALAGGGYLVAGESFWLLSPKEKFKRAWKQDIELLVGAKNSSASNLLSRARAIAVRSDGPGPASEWLETVPPPIVPNEKNGDLRLEILVVHQFSEPSDRLFPPQRYGTLIQYEFIEQATGNKVGEFARTLWLGIYH